MANPVQQGNVYSGPPGAGVLTINGVTAGHALIVLIGRESSAAREYVINTNLDAGHFVKVASSVPAFGSFPQYVFVKFSVSGGDHSIDVAQVSHPPQNFFATVLQAENLDALGTVIASAFYDGVNDGEHFAGAVGEVDTTGPTFMVAIGRISGSNSGTVAGSGWTKATVGGNQQHFMYRESGAAESDQRGRFTNDGTARFAYACMAAFPLVAAGTSGTSAGAAAAATAAASGAPIVAGTVDGSASAGTAAAAGSPWVAGDVAGAVSAGTGAAAGAPIIAGDVAGAAAPGTVAAGGSPIISGDAAGAVSPGTVSAAGGSGDGAIVDGVVSPADVSAAGAPVIVGAVDGAAAPGSGAAAGAPVIAGGAAGTAAPGDASAAGTPIVSGGADGAAGASTGAAAGSTTVTGTASGTASPATVAAVGGPVGLAEPVDVLEALARGRGARVPRAVGARVPGRRPLVM